MERLYLLMTGGAPILGALVGTLALTLLVGRLTQRRFQWLILFPLGFLAIPLAGSVYEWLLGGFFWKLGVLLWVIIGGCIFLGWLGGWALCRGKERAP